ncbi:MAG: lysine 2,3-aminomutase [Candidatus Schekmanbacteria bacterium GWA2_38_9]|uniref:L-lysine 2,3-aminomutase n=1 Tax=Candidatus Schekmanbacteria bacterium RIFCSPLOWO2_12_FULL_38_15 TaxID=1817883 RepID=A0A1F7SGD1_9BACT|nr:MAG: lysine 2,3-aminomutase [Candidatus Schekmanbacteria bacterium GWA2_38_9]OGL49337.1 MAG: lysine 2,3-aminomutase [Candidatus Schekmanbacteria bacterium RIFCSPLOWO2_02_FULL_38_14]OGL52815.1 MAG: lysine 2,3-aminomutase [Candidatus Schekmanbacteria bacterium RIFCSPLOWO2_12_FULL_38_15]
MDCSDRPIASEIEKVIKASYWKDVPDEEWNNWQWQIKNRLTAIEDLSRIIELSDEELAELKKVTERFKMSITPYFASLIDKNDPNCPIRKQAIPSKYELQKTRDNDPDPLDEDIDSPVPGLTHRYPDRALLITTDRCGTLCRHCTRKRSVGMKDIDKTKNELNAMIEYIKNTKTIRDVLLSGGDPLLISPLTLEFLLKSLRKIPHVEIIRIGTRIPVTLPQRITPELVEMISRYHPVWINTHFNHPKEITQECAQAIDLLLRSGIPVGSQTVLLKDVNDCPHIMKKLMHKLLMIRVRPYYIFQCDLSVGVEHFRTSVLKGIEIIEMLRGHTSGLGVPAFVIDGPGGMGKVPVMPNYLISYSEKGAVIRNYEGSITVYEEPKSKKFFCQKCGICKEQEWISREGVAKLFLSQTESLVPSGSERENRRKKISSKGIKKETCKEQKEKEKKPVQIPFSFVTRVQASAKQFL